MDIHNAKEIILRFIFPLWMEREYKNLQKHCIYERLNVANMRSFIFHRGKTEEK